VPANGRLPEPGASLLKFMGRDGRNHRPTLAAQPHQSFNAIWKVKEVIPGY
jgi:hypothetical protein